MGAWQGSGLSGSSHRVGSQENSSGANIIHFEDIWACLQAAGMKWLGNQGLDRMATSTLTQRNSPSKPWLTRMESTWTFRRPNSHLNIIKTSSKRLKTREKER